MARFDDVRPGEAHSLVLRREGDVMRLPRAAQPAEALAQLQALEAALPRAQGRRPRATGWRGS